MLRGTLMVGIGEWAVSRDASDVLVTHSLGSCVGVSVYHPDTGVGAMLHAMLPLSSLDPVRGAARPALFMDTGMRALLQAVFDLGATRSGLIVAAAGGACQFDEEHFFRIGERNRTVLRKVLWKNGILLAAEDTGGTVTRTLYLDMSTGLTHVRVDGELHALQASREG